MGNSPSKISAKDRAILDMKLQRDKLQQYKHRISIVTEREREVAKECLLRGQKNKALLALRRKKYQESLLAKADDQLEQLQRLTADVEFAALQKDVMFGLQQGTAVLKQIHAEMGGIEGVEKLLDESAEARAYEKEISDMLGGQLSNADEDEVEDELEAMEKAAAGPQRADVDPTPVLPTVPDMDPVATEAQMAAEAKRRREARAARQKQEMDPIAA